MYTINGRTGSAENNLVVVVNGSASSLAAPPVSTVMVDLSLNGLRGRMSVKSRIDPLFCCRRDFALFSPSAVDDDGNKDVCDPAGDRPGDEVTTALKSPRGDMRLLWLPVV